MGVTDGFTKNLASHGIQHACLSGRFGPRNRHVVGRGNGVGLQGLAIEVRESQGFVGTELNLLRSSKFSARIHHHTVGVCDGPAAISEVTAHAIFVSVGDAENVAPFFQAEIDRHHFAVRAILVRTAFVEGLAQTLERPRRFAAVVVQHQGQRVVEGGAFVGGELHRGGVVQGVLVRHTVGCGDRHFHGVGAALGSEGRKGHDIRLEGLERPCPRLLLGGAAVDAVFEHAAGQGVFAGVGQRDFNGHLFRTTQHIFRRACDVHAGIVVEGHGAIGVAIPHFGS